MKEVNEMAKLDLTLTNNYMKLNIIALVGDNALLARLNDNSFVVANGLKINEDLTCTWAFAYGYYESYDRAFACFNEKVLKDFQEYAEVIS